MSVSSVDGIHLSPDNNVFSIDKCIICQRKTGDLTSQEDGRQKVIETSQKLKDNLLYFVHDLSSIKYHMKCYRSYGRKGDRVTDKSKRFESTLDEGPSCSKRSKRASVSGEKQKYYLYHL